MRRTRINLLTFAVLSVVMIVWSAANLFPIDAINRPYTVTAEFESSPGLSPGFAVTYLGTSVGTIGSVKVEPGMSVVTLKIERGIELPQAVDAQARRRSAIGEPYVNLSPRPGTDPDEGPRLAGGDRIDLEHTQTPIRYADLFNAVQDLVDAVDPEPFGTIVHEISAALQDRGDDWRTLLVGAQVLSTDLVENADQIDRMIDDLALLAGIAADHRDTIAASLDGLTTLADTLGELEGPVNEFITDAPPLVNLLNRMLERADGSLLCTVGGLTALREIATPEALAALADSIDHATLASGIIEHVRGEEGFANASLTLDATEDPVVYDTRVPPPQAPAIPGCADFDVDFTAAGATGGAGPGAGGQGSTGPDGTIIPPDITEKTDVTLAGASALGEPPKPLLAKVVDWFVPAAAIALLAGAAWMLFGIYRARRAS